jgi:hypothetical protein
MGFKEPDDIEAKWRGRQDYTEIVRAANAFVSEHLSEEAHVKRWAEVLARHSD